MSSPTPTSVRIAAVSGAVTDRNHGFESVAREESVQYIVGDWMSEANMATRGIGKVSSNGVSEEFEPSFLEAFEPALPHLAAKGIKVAVNAGASDTEKLYHKVVDMIKTAGLNLTVSWVEGDEVMHTVQKALDGGTEFRSLTTDKKLSEWEFTPLYAQCYLGSFGIVEALKNGADIVLCGRVADACPTIACSIYHFGWGRQDYKRLASALVAGHLIECSNYVTGGNFTGFKSLPGESADIGYPIAEVTAEGDFSITKQRGKDGMVTVDTCKSQLLYEIQGPLYYNSDVVAKLDQIKMKQAGENRVSVTDVGGLPPPPTTKVGIIAKGGFQAEAHYYLCGLDLEEKARMFERQIRAMLDETKYHTLKFRLNGRCPEDPRSQDAATADLRVFAQARDAADLVPDRFIRPIMDNIMQSYPGATFSLDPRQGIPKPYFECFMSLLPQDSVNHVCHVPSKGVHTIVDPPTDTKAFVRQQESYETAHPIEFSQLGSTERAPLGYVVHARSGDKGSDCNVGFFVRHSDEWDWLRSLLTVDKVREMLADEDTGKPIYRFELPHLSAVHFLLKDHLDRGATSSSTYDVLGKNVAEYLRSKRLEIPTRFLKRGRI